MHLCTTLFTGASRTAKRFAFVAVFVAIAVLAFSSAGHAATSTTPANFAATVGEASDCSGSTLTATVSVNDASLVGQSGTVSVNALIDNAGDDDPWVGTITAITGQPQTITLNPVYAGEKIYDPPQADRPVYLTVGSDTYGPLDVTITSCTVPPPTIKLVSYGHTLANDSYVEKFTLVGTGSLELTVASYSCPNGCASLSTEVPYRHLTANYVAGTYTVPVALPTCGMFQADFARGGFIDLRSGKIYGSNRVDSKIGSVSSSCTATTSPPTSTTTTVIVPTSTSSATGVKYVTDSYGPPPTGGVSSLDILFFGAGGILLMAGVVGYTVRNRRQGLHRA